MYISGFIAISSSSTAWNLFMCSFCTRLIDSMPPPIATSTPSSMIERAATAIACRPEAHCRSIVVPATVTGRPARIAPLRATFITMVPCCIAQPITTSSTSPGSMPARLAASAITWPAMVGPSVLFSAPRKALPTPVRAVETITASVAMLASLLCSRVELHVTQQVVSGIAELDVDGGDSLEVMADVQFVGHAHAAVQLNRLVGDELAGIADLRLGAGGEARDTALAGTEAKIEMLHQGKRLLMGNEHVDHPVLQHLEAANGDAELLSRLGVFQRR